jgi:photosystem II stability/assembly factor-like uncharacterized protein
MAAAILFLSACGQATSGVSGSRPASEPVNISEVDVGMEWGHIHDIVIQGDKLWIGTHYGLWLLDLAGEVMATAVDRTLDVMGLTHVSGSTLLASGHPALGERGPGNVGLLQSTDGGASWATLSLSGTADFHRLTAAGDLVLGISSHDGRLYRSTDGGRTWANPAETDLFDMAIEPTQGRDVLGTSASGVQRSRDGGQSFESLPGAPRLVFIHWDSAGVIGVDGDGQIWISGDGDSPWTRAGKVDGELRAMASDGQHVVVLAGGRLWESQDRGVSMTSRLSNLP